MDLTVKELINKLKKFDEDYIVKIEGCDCYGFAKDVEKLEYKGKPADEKEILITRNFDD